MRAYTSDQLIKAIRQIAAERTATERQELTEDVAVLDEELEELRLTLLKLRWSEVSRGQS